MKSNNEPTGSEAWCVADVLTPIGNAFTLQVSALPLEDHRHWSGEPGSALEGYHVELLTFRAIQVITLRWNTAPLWVERWVGSSFYEVPAGQKNIALRLIRPDVQPNRRQLERTLHGRDLLFVQDRLTKRPGAPALFENCGDFITKVSRALDQLWSASPRPTRPISRRRLATQMNIDRGSLDNWADDCEIPLDEWLGVRSE